MSEKRFARQHIYRPPPAFPPASSCTGIVHHLSGPSDCAPAQTFHRRSWLADGARCRSHLSLSLRLVGLRCPPTRALARLLGPCFKTGRWTSFSGCYVAAVLHEQRSTSARAPATRGDTAPGSSATRAGTSKRPGRLPPPRVGITRAQHARPSLPTVQFHALFHSLASGLFIVPSRYFFAIGLPPVFSLRWGLPPNWGCIPKQPDSPCALREGLRSAYGTLTLCGDMFQNASASLRPGGATADYNSPASRRFTYWANPFSLAVTGGIPVGFFSSAY